MNTIVKTFAAVSVLCLAGQASASDLILNEWNAVGPTKTLEGGECDPAFSSCPTPAVGNGGDWIELVVTADNVDLRGWEIHWQNDDGSGKDGTITFENNALWDGTVLDAGTIIIIREDAGFSTDLSYSHSCSAGAWAGDWVIEIDASDTTYVTQSGDAFQVDNDGWRAEINDTSGTVQDFVGESSCTFCTGSGINSREVGKLEEDPSSTPSSNGYNDGNCSSYGAENCWTTDSVDYLQCFDSMRCGGSC